MNNKHIIAIFLITCTVMSILYFKSSEYISKNIVVLLQEYSLTYDIDKKSMNNNVDIMQENISFASCKELIKKITHFVRNKKPIILTMVGFPYKSSNTRDKVLSSVADAAERYSLVYIHTLLEKIKEIYEPGVKLFIFTDGIAFSDIEKVSDETVIEYENSLKTLVQDLPYIKIITTRDICPNKSPEEIRTLISIMNPSTESFYEMLDTDKKLQDDVAVLTQRLAFELALLSLTDNEIIEIGLKETQRSLQYSNFLKQFRPEEAITCSVHYQKDPNRKIGLKLSESCVTPWHGVLIETNGNFTIEHLKDIDQMYYQKVYQDTNNIRTVYLKKK